MEKSIQSHEINLQLLKEVIDKDAKYLEQALAQIMRLVSQYEALDTQVEEAKKRHLTGFDSAQFLRVKINYQH